MTQCMCWMWLGVGTISASGFQKCKNRLHQLNDYQFHSKDFCRWSSLDLGPIGICLGHAIAQFVKALRYKPEGCGFDSRWCHRNFTLT